jgi:DNA (cytosine-5)-methyltransferase 1
LGRIKAGDSDRLEHRENLEPLDGCRLEFLLFESNHPPSNRRCCVEVHVGKFEDYLIHRRTDWLASKPMADKVSRGTEYEEPKKAVGSVAELFAGVGGFRIGLARAGWRTVFSNQWEPSTKAQHASEVYVHRFGPGGHTNEDIKDVLDRAEKGSIELPEATLLVGGFPCQDYSVAKTLKTSRGIQGKKGVLWWQILRFIEMRRPPLVLLENVDRLLKSPASRRGRDFAVMLSSLCNEGYMVEWRVVNAAEYGFPQRRKRVFIVAKRTDVFVVHKNWDATSHLVKSGVLARALPVFSVGKGSDKKAILDAQVDSFELDDDLAELSERFGERTGPTRFKNAGVVLNHVVSTVELEPDCPEQGSLGSVMLPEEEVDDSYFVPKSQIAQWKYLKGAKREERTHAASGSTYIYSEGSMAFPDLPENPARTILTGEGGSSPSRFKHIVRTPSGRYRRLTPVELELLNGFPAGWTAESANGPISDVRRAFFMGNALVVGVVELIGRQLAADWRKAKSK